LRTARALDPISFTSISIPLHSQDLLARGKGTARKKKKEGELEDEHQSLRIPGANGQETPGV